MTQNQLKILREVCSKFQWLAMDFEPKTQEEKLEEAQMWKKMAEQLELQITH